MINKNVIGLVLKEAGIITVTGDRCKCSACGATGHADNLDIKHRDACPALDNVAAFLDTLRHDKDTLPGIIYKPMEFSDVLPYYQELTRDEINEAEALATQMFAAATPQTRQQLKQRFERSEPTLKGDHIISHITTVGLDTNTDRINFRHYLVFCKAQERIMTSLQAEEYQADLDGRNMQDSFDNLFMPSIADL